MAISLHGSSKNSFIPACSGGVSEPGKSESPSSSISNTLATLFPWSCVLSWVGPMEATQEGLTVISLLRHFSCWARGHKRLSLRSLVSHCHWKSERKYLWEKKHRWKRGKSSAIEAINSQNLLQSALQARCEILFPCLLKATINLVLSMFILLKHSILANCVKRYKISTPGHKTLFLLPKYLLRQDKSPLLLTPPGDFNSHRSKCARGKFQILHLVTFVKATSNKYLSAANCSGSCGMYCSRHRKLEKTVLIQ